MDTCGWDLEKFCPIWNQKILKQNLEYSRRLKLAQSMNESECLLWPTPTAHIAKEAGYPAEYTRNSPTITAIALGREGLSPSTGRMNPEYLEWMMGLPTGFTELGF